MLSKDPEKRARQLSNLKKGKPMKKGETLNPNGRPPKSRMQVFFDLIAAAPITDDEMIQITRKIEVATADECTTIEKMEGLPLTVRMLATLKLDFVRLNDDPDSSERQKERAYRLYRDNVERILGKPKQAIDATTNGKDLNLIQVIVPNDDGRFEREDKA